ncbi:MAG: Fe-S-containing hydro-lyase [candidate division WOR-3 bacterium]
MARSITTPLSKEQLRELRAGDPVLITGTIYTGRDLAHQRLAEAIREDRPLPFDINGAIMYYVGPSPAKPGQCIGSAGPTTSYRMDPYTPLLIEHGLAGTIGKGNRSRPVIEAMVKHGAVYFAACGGCAALISRSIKAARTIAYPELGPEAVQELIVENFPCIVINDTLGNDLYEQGIKTYRKE